MRTHFLSPSGFLTYTVLLSSVCFHAYPAETQKQFTEKERAYWAFQKIKRPAPPEVKQKEWVRNPIDSFILRALEQKGISAGREADKATLLRRLSFDLIGLPPSPEEVQAFLSDKSADAYERLVDRLLASPHYGERWGRHWLDVARYAESDGFRADEPRPNIWRYRDYVVRSFNEDKGYDRFMREQIAGDELWPNDPQARIATAFSRHYSDEWNARNLMQRRQEILQDVTDAVGSAFLGLTMGCAKCHDHKFDPILHRDYYRLQAFFAHTANDDRVPAITASEMAAERKKSTEWETATREIRREITALMQEAREEVTRDEFFKFPDLIKDAVAKDPAKRTPYEQQMAHRAKVISEPSDFMAMTRLKGEKKKRYDELQASLRSFDHLYHRDEPLGSGMRDLGSEAPPTHVLAVGNYERTGGRGPARLLDDSGSEPRENLRAAGPAVNGPAHGSGELARRSSKPTDSTGDGESAMAPSFRRGHCSHAGRLRADGSAFYASRTTRLACFRIRAKRLEPEAHAPADGDVERLSSVVRLP